MKEVFGKFARTINAPAHPSLPPSSCTMDDLELTYEHIDWVDIADAELSGDQEAIQRLMYVKTKLVPSYVSMI